MGKDFFLGGNPQTPALCIRIPTTQIILLYTMTVQTPAGMILAVRHNPYEITRRLLLILNHVTADEMENQLRYI